MKEAERVVGAGLARRAVRIRRSAWAVATPLRTVAELGRQRHHLELAKNYEDVEIPVSLRSFYKSN